VFHKARHPSRWREPQFLEHLSAERALGPYNVVRVISRYVEYANTLVLARPSVYLESNFLCVFWGSHNLRSLVLCYNQVFVREVALLSTHQCKFKLTNELLRARIIGLISRKNLSCWANPVSVTGFNIYYILLLGAGYHRVDFSRTTLVAGPILVW